MKNIKCSVIPKKQLNIIKSDLETHLNLENVQSYYPLMSLFMEFYNESDTNFVFNSNFIVTKILEKIEIKNNDTYIKHFFKSEITNQFTHEKYAKEIFIKILPVLNIIKYMMNKYRLETNGLSNIQHHITSKKMNDMNNMAYIDVFFSFIGSKLTEEGKCPTFPLFYGTFSGIADEFMYDITEEYSSMKRESWYKLNHNKLFEIKTVEMDIPGNTSFKKHKINIKSLKENDIGLLDIESILENNIDCELENTYLSECNNLDSEIVDSNNDIILGKGLNKINGNSGNSGDSGSRDSGDSGSRDSGDSVGDSGSRDSGDSGSRDSGDSVGDSGDSGSRDSGDSVGDSDWSDIDSTLSINSGSLYNDNENFEVNYSVIKNMPVQINCIEKLMGTLDNYIEEKDKIIEDNEWLSILFQICFGLSVAQKQYNFVHNDLHSSNIMFKETNIEFLYFQFYDTYFKIPTYKKITKIIDFGRAIFNYKSKLFFSDVFKKDGDAEGQYSYPYLNNIKHCRVKPNYSFDLSRLATTIIEHFDEDEESEIYKLLKLWCMDKYGNFLMENEDSFDLYKIIAKNVISAIPKKQINKKIFKRFIVNKNDIKPDEYVYKY